MKIRSIVPAVITAGLALPLAAGAADNAKFSKNEIVIGVLTDMSGPYASLTGEGDVAAAQLAIDEFGGKINGVPIKLVSADHQQKADVSSAKAREWIDKDGVDMITALGQSALGLAVQAVASDKKVITMNTGAGSPDLTGSQCTKYGIHYSWNNHAVAVGTASAVVEGGGKTWFFLAADYTFGKSLQDQATKVIESMGGKVLGGVRAPLGTSDYSSFLLQAQGSKAQVIGLANAGADTLNSLKQANEFGIVKGGQKVAALLMFITDVHSLGLPVAQGLQFTTAYYWDRTDASRDLGKRFYEKRKSMPNMDQAGTYSAVRTYLKAVQAVGTDNSDAVRAQLGKMEIDDGFSKGRIRADGLFQHDMYLVEAKKPSESKSEWDLLKVNKTIPANVAYQSLKDGGCKLVQ
ncbi:MAG: ABC transporter substrate-binding protein [Burkholderiales bacterium]|uniref:ABC transporter substrate-binding protein n=1 Tax=Ottowia sp. TaxID=1898956 RepID=UPI001AC45EB2|nr:ABC transporter substrate-binding protein [Ottowia sp.]MBN9404457.1 ABC transporter substrate-binding protein [Burkholderiales bacterium]